MKKINSNLHEITPTIFEKLVDMGLGLEISFKFTNKWRHLFYDFTTHIWNQRGLKQNLNYIHTNDLIYMQDHYDK